MFVHPIQINTRRLEYNWRGQQGFRTLCCDVFGLLKDQFLSNNNNKGSRPNVNKHELVNGESSSNARDSRCLFILFVLQFKIFIIVIAQKLVLKQSKNVTAKCLENLSHSPCILYLLATIKPDQFILLVGKPGTVISKYIIQCTTVYTVQSTVIRARNLKEYPFWGLIICVDFDLKELKKWKNEETK